MRLLKLFCLCICIASISPNVALSKLGTPELPEYLNGQFIVTTDKGVTEFRQSVEHGGFKYVEELPFGFHLIQGEQKAEAKFARSRLFQVGARTVQPNFTSRVDSAPANPQWALDNPATGADIRALNGWKYLAKIPGAERKIRIAIIDSGIDLQSKEFAGRIDLNRSYNFVGSNGNIQDYNGHGTHVAGIIGASHAATSRILGVNPNAEFVILKAFTMYGFATTSSLLKALDAAIKAKVKIINASYGSNQYDPAQFEALQKVQQAGILFVAAAGNDGRDTDVKPYYPANYDLPNIVSVGASDRNDQPAWFSNFGTKSVDVFAPGADILSSVVHVTFKNRQKVFSLAMNDTVDADWKTEQTSKTYEGPTWTFTSCDGAAGKCLNFRTPKEYSPSERYDFFDIKYLKSLKSDQEKRYSVITTAKYSFPSIDWDQEVTGSPIAGGNLVWMLPAKYLRKSSTGWTDVEIDISKPVFFYAGTTAWDQIFSGFSVSFSKMAGHPEYRNAQMQVSGFSIVNEEPVSTSAIESYNGTSMATPHVVGIASWLLAKDPSATPEAIKKRIMETCDPVTVLSKKAICGGRVNLYEAAQ